MVQVALMLLLQLLQVMAVVVVMMVVEVESVVRGVGPSLAKDPRVAAAAVQEEAALAAAKDFLASRAVSQHVGTIGYGAPSANSKALSQQCSRSPSHCNIHNDQLLNWGTGDRGSHTTRTNNK
jgi:hypothetical protein